MGRPTPDWQREHERLFDENGDLTEYGRRIYETPPQNLLPPGKPKLRTTRVSALAHDLVKALEAASMKIARASQQEDVEEAFGPLSAAREVLYSYLEGLEHHVGVPRTIQLRF